MNPQTEPRDRTLKKPCNTIIFRKDTRKKDVLNFRVDAELYQKIQEKSKEFGGISNLIRIAVLEKFEGHNSNGGILQAGLIKQQKRLL